MIDILLFLFSNNFLHYANYFSILMIMVLMARSKFKVRVIKKVSFLFLILASLTYCFLYLRNYTKPSSSTLYLVFISPIILYYVGFVQGNQSLDLFKKEIFLISFGGVIHGVMNVVKNRGVDILSIAGRSYADIYGGQISGTLQNLFFIVSSALLFYFLAIEKKRFLRFWGSIAGISGIVGSIVNASRTMIFVTFITFFVCLFIYFYEKYGFGSSLFRFVGTGTALICIVLLLLWTNIFNIQQILLGSALGQRETAAVQTSSVFHNLRWQYAGEILKMLPSNPLGGIDYAHYAHNLWLDVAKEVGIIPFCFYVLFSAMAVVITFRLFGNEKLELEYKFVIVPVIIAFMLTFFTEPIMQGSPISFSLFCFIVGGIEGVNSKSVETI